MSNDEEFIEYEEITYTKAALITVLIIGLGIGLSAGWFAGSFFSSSQTNSTFSTVINIKGSDTLLEVTQFWVSNYTTQNKDVIINLAGGGTGTGISALISGTADIATASRLAKTDEIALAETLGKTLIAHSVLVDGIAIITNLDVGQTNITYNQLRGIFNGSINYWDEINSSLSHTQIVTYGRQSTSGTYAYFQEEVMENDDYRSDMNQLLGNQQIIIAVSQQSGSIGYVGASYIHGNEDIINVLAVSRTGLNSAVYPTKESIKNLSYPISRYLYMYTLGYPTGYIQAFITWCQSPQGQEIAEQRGYVAIY
ncbi:MAG: PstS family phosphate ABC transporter substrate-binding protein [Candidatus Odinarchaeia archaeon]